MTELRENLLGQQRDEFHHDKSEATCYEGTLDCCGGFWGGLRAYLPCVCCCAPYPYIQVVQGHKGLRQTFGKFEKILGPGFHYVNPCTQNVIMVNTKTHVLDLQRQEILTKDNIVASIDTVVYYRVYDAARSQYRVKEISHAVAEITFATLRTVCGEHTLEQILRERQKIADEIEGMVVDTAQEWGVYMEQVFIKDMVLPRHLESELSLTTKAKRTAEAKVISAKADVESAKILRSAADMLDSKAAMQIRYFDTVNLIADGSSQKVLFLSMNQKGQKQ